VTEPSTQDLRSSGPRLLGVEAAAQYLGVSTWTVRDLIERRALPRVVLPGVRRLLFDQRDVDRLIEASK
jgi:excisionase family DNA binding protein